MVRINFLPHIRSLFSETQWTVVSLVAMGIFLLHSLWFGQSLVLYVAVLLVVGWSILLYPSVGLPVILVCTMWFERHFTLQSLQIGVTAYKFYPLDFVLLFSCLSVALRLYFKEYGWRRSRFDTPIILFALVGTLGYVLSFVRDYDPVLAFGTYKNYVLYSIVFVYATLVLKSKTDWQALMNWFTIGGFGLFFFLSYGLLAGQGLWSEFTPLSTVGVRLIAGTHTFYFVLFGFWALANYLWPEPFTDRKNNIHIAWHGVFLLVGAAILVSLVRHLWAALAALFILWMVILPGLKRSLVTLLVGRTVLFAGITLLLYTWSSVLFTGLAPKEFAKQWYILKERVNVTSVVNLEDTSFSWRVAVWQAGGQLWAHYPVFGTGLGSTVSGHLGVTPFNVASRELHNDYVGMLVQLGLVGIGTVIFWFYSLARMLWKLWMRYKNEVGFENQMLFLWGNTVLLFMIVFSISVYWDINLFVIWWWLALAGVRYLAIGDT